MVIYSYFNDIIDITYFYDKKREPRFGTGDGYVLSLWIDVQDENSESRFRIQGLFVSLTAN